MRINILDPGLRVKNGHHLPMALGLRDELLNSGYDAVIYAHRAVDKAILDNGKGAGLIPHFRAHSYDIDQKYLDDIAGEYFNFELHTNTLIEDLRSLRTADLNVWPSLYAPHLNAYSLSGTDVPMTCCLQLSSDSPAWQGLKFGNLWWRIAFINAMRSKIRISIGAFESFLLDDFSRHIARSKMRILPVPYDQRMSLMDKKELKRIGFFGDQRPEKGGHLISKIAQLAVSSGINVVIQNSKSGSRESISTDGITMLGFIDDLSLEISKCDLVILPYDPNQYTNRGSGILWEALAAGVPVIVPSGTGLESNIGGGGGLSFVEYTAENIFQTILSAKTHYSLLLNQAQSISKCWPLKNGMRKFASSLSEIESCRQLV
jgi:glycosyltransferase involved in cell wall biosynthesis